MKFVLFGELAEKKCLYKMDEYNNYYLSYIAQSSEEILAELKNNNRELNALRQQMANANALQQQMLQNQIRDIEERETQKFYKLRSFKLSQLVTAIGGLSDINQKAFTYYVFKDTVMQNATEAQANLNEISDKEYCNTLFAKMRDIAQQIGDIKDLSIAEYLEKYINGPSEYNRLCNELNVTKSKLSSMSPPQKPVMPTSDNPGLWVMGFGIVAILVGIAYAPFVIVLGGLFAVLGFVLKWNAGKETAKYEEAHKRYNDDVIKYEANVSETKKKISELEDKIANCDYVKALNYFFTYFPSWKVEIDNHYKQLAN